MSLIVFVVGCAAEAPETPTIVVVNGKPITQSELDYRWSELPDTMRVRYQSQGGKRRFLDDLITRELLLQEARRQGLEHTLPVLERVERLKEQVLLDELINDLAQAHRDVNDAELDAYLDAHSAIMAHQIKGAQILVATEAQAKDLKRQMERGADFGKLAQRYSLDEGTKAKGGEFGVYRKGVVASELEPVLLALKPGAVSEPILSPAGYHLVKVLSRDAEEVAAARAARQRLKQEVLAEKRRKRVEDMLAKLRASATIRMADVSVLAVEESPRATGLQ